ncbi:hypothetical protein L228DRAFT_241161 [Xylona heveae TC161]|uniref:Uncharacterized protein n=1 Tax=Xylona heveae (strain CBS 132557 / TC161) TaxID=1328760 RepID=A0A165A4Y1_XYLHT|nr:hypothetical protein L228DRAFT_241161 [Xylona heveae TC161]KZF19955.1 hypothetical protein L228DRAFT_241161 [Xylona heveae TC161]
MILLPSTTLLRNLLPAGFSLNLGYIHQEELQTAETFGGCKDGELKEPQERHLLENPFQTPPIPLQKGYTIYQEWLGMLLLLLITIILLPKLLAQLGMSKDLTATSLESSALGTLQEVAEATLVKEFKMTNLMAIHAKRVTI